MRFRNHNIVSECFRLCRKRIQCHLTAHIQPCRFKCQHGYDGFFTNRIQDTSATNVKLERLLKNGDVKVLGELHDDGKNGDTTASDHVYSGKIQMNEEKVGSVTLRVSADIQGKVAYSPLYDLAVLPKGAPTTTQAPNLKNIAKDHKTGQEFIADEVIACFKPKVDFNAVTKMAKQINGVIFGRLSELGNCYQIRVPSSKDGSTVLKAIKKLKAMSGVESASPDSIRRISMIDFHPAEMRSPSLNPPAA